MEKAKKKSFYPYQVFLVDLLILACMFLVYLLIFREAFIFQNSWTASAPLSIFFVAVSLAIIGYGLIFFFERRCNHLRFPKLFIILAIVIVVSNIIAIATTPSTIIFAKDQPSVVITPFQYAYGVISGLLVACIPLLLFYVVPRRIRHTRYISYFLYANLILLAVFVIISFFTDSQHYLDIFKNGFSDTNAVQGLFHKNVYGGHLMVGIFVIIMLDVVEKKWPWLLLTIPVLLLEFCTFAKIAIFLSLLILLAYLIYKLIKVATKNKDNLIITLLALGFVLVVGSILIVLMVNSQSGILFTIKELLSKFVNSAKATWSSRMIIWESALSTLGPLQYIFGRSYAFSGIFVHYAYAYNPLCPEDPSGIWQAHNMYVQNIMEGGIIYLLINLFLIGYIVFVALKIMKKHKDLGVFTLMLVAARLLFGMVECSTLLGADNWAGVLLNLVLVLPVMGVYYSTFDKNEVAIKQKIVKDAKEVKKVEFKYWFLKIEQKLLLTSAKYIEVDLKHEQH